MADIFVATTANAVQNTEKNSDKQRLQENHLHALSSFCQNPVGMSFQNQDPDETILLVLRAHFITNIPWIAISVVLALLPFLLNTFFPDAFAMFFPIQPAVRTILFGFYYLLILGYALVSFITWFYNIMFITNKRVVDVDFSDVIHHDIATTKLNLIEDIKYVQTGFLRSLFNYGDVFIQTAGESLNFEALAVPNPSLAVQIVGDLIGDHGA
ncbi:MAG: hypothetical protein HY429_00800 [Candidatus Levybacteria bacterium]|nr:hypothetical protein [Candidatus Levybacteria bacterium]